MGDHYHPSMTSRHLEKHSDPTRSSEKAWAQGWHRAFQQDFRLCVWTRLSSFHRKSSKHWPTGPKSHLKCQPRLPTRKLSFQYPSQGGSGGLRESHSTQGGAALETVSGQGLEGLVCAWREKASRVQLHWEITPPLLKCRHWVPSPGGDHPAKRRVHSKQIPSTHTAAWSPGLQKPGNCLKKALDKWWGSICRLSSGFTNQPWLSEHRSIRHESAPSMLVPRTAPPLLSPSLRSSPFALALVHFLEGGKERGRSLFWMSYLNGLRS